MPFNVVASKGGPYEDQAYVAGFEAGRIWGRLEDMSRYGGADVDTVHTTNLPQLDLVAMHFGYILETTSPDIDGWTHITLRPDLSLGDPNTRAHSPP